MRPRSPYAERRHHLERAREDLLRAAAVTLDDSGDDALAAAELWTGRALIHFAKADVSGRARELALQTLEHVKAEREAAGEAPLRAPGEGQ